MQPSAPTPAADSPATPANAPWQVAAARVATSAAWPAAARASALARLDDRGLPTGAEEEWRYTSLDAYQARWTACLAAGPAPPRPGPPPRAAPPPGTVHLDLVDGRLAPGSTGLPPGLVAGSLATLPARVRPRAEALLARADALAPDVLVDLNTALATDVVIVATEPGHDLGDRPVHLDIRGVGGVFAQPRILVDVAPGSRLVLSVEHSGGAGLLANAVLQAWVGQDARLSLVRAQVLPDDALLTDSTRLELAGGASAEVMSAELGAALGRHALTIVLAGASASATVAGLFVADGERHLDTRTRIEHRAPATTSREQVRGLADGSGRGVFNGKIIVLPGAAGSDAALSNRNLLLAATAEIDTKPELEIYVDDVRCSHGATTGQLDPAALFYLRSRGLDPGTARQLLTGAFLREPVAALPAGVLRDRLEGHLRARLGSGLLPPGDRP